MVVEPVNAIQQPDPADTGSVEVQLYRQVSEPCWRVTCVTLSSQKDERRIQALLPSPLPSMFVPEVATVLEEQLHTVSETSVCNHSELALTLPGLEIQGLCILTQVSTNGDMTACVRFTQTTGDAWVMFLSPLPSDTPMPVNLDAITFSFVQDLLNPALEVVNHILENGLSETDAKVLAARVKTMGAKRDALADYISLLNQYLDPRHAVQEQLKTAPKNMSLSSQDAHSHRTITWSASSGPVRGEYLGILHGHHGAVKLH